jgi:hypothetical protein
MKRLYSLFLALLLAVVAAMPSLALEPAPESVLKSNVRIPQQLIIGGSELFNSQFLGPSLVFRPSTAASSSLDTTVTVTTPSAARTYTLPDAGGSASFVMTAGAQTIAGVKTFSSSPVLSTGIITANGDSNTIPDLGNASFVMTEGTQTINGTKTFGTPLVKASVNNSVKRHRLTVPVVNGTIADGTTYTLTIPIGRACTITGAFASIGTAISGGVNTLTISKNGGNTLLSTADVDPTTFGANATTALTLTATGADLAFVAGDCVKIVHVAGTQGTDGVGESVTIEYEITDF